MTYIYIMQLREFLGSEVYKIGRSSNIHNRYKQYPNGSVMKYCCEVSDSVSAEKAIKDSLHTYVCKEYGYEYVKIAYPELLKIVNGIVMNFVNLLVENAVPCIMLDKSNCLTYIDNYIHEHHKSLYDQGGEIRTCVFYSGFEDWCKDNNLDSSRLSHSYFTTIIKNEYGVLDHSKRYADGLYRVLIFPVRRLCKVELLTNFIDEMVCDQYKDLESVKNSYNDLNRLFGSWLDSKGIKMSKIDNRQFGKLFRNEFTALCYNNTRLGGGTKAVEIFIKETKAHINKMSLGTVQDNI